MHLVSEWPPGASDDSALDEVTYGLCKRLTCCNGPTCCGVVYRGACSACGAAYASKVQVVLGTIVLHDRVGHRSGIRRTSGNLRKVSVLPSLESRASCAGLLPLASATHGPLRYGLHPCQQSYS